MAANGGGPPLSLPLIKKEEGGSDDLDQNDHHDHNNVVGSINNNMKGISIADRRAAKCGFNADNINTARFGPGCNNASLSPYVTIPPGISPSALFESPMLVPNAQAQQSPTTGTFHQFPLSSNPDQSLKLKLKLASEEDGSSFKPEPDNFTLENLQPFEEYFDQFPRDFQETSKNEEGQSLHQPSKNTSNQMSRESGNTNINNINPNYQEIKNHHQKGAYVPKEVAKHSEDGFYWRKYGQKHVKGSEFPRSYYKCTNANCLVKKKVERSHAGEITQIVYKGSHNHPIPQPFNNKRFNDMANDHGGGTSFKAEGANKDVAVLGSDHNWVPGHACLASQFPNNNPLPITNFDQTHVEAMTNHDFSANTTVGSQDGEDQNQASPESITCKDEYDENNTECEPKKRKRENLASNETTIPRSGRESKVVVQIESDVDILDDGYRWRKYGQKVVKGNPNPRSYYKCTTPGCPVRKHVERAANDIKSVLTTYEGKHNHDVPTSKTGSLVVSEASSMLQQVIANNNNNNNIVGSPKAPENHHVSNKAGKQAQDSSNLPLYMGGKPILSYNDFMRSNLTGSFSTGHDLGFGTPSSLYPYSFPSFPTVAYSSHFMNANNSNNNNNNNHHLKMYSSSSSKFSYPMLAPDYLSQMSLHVPGGPAATHVPNVGAGLAFNSYAGLQNTSQGPREQIMKPKEEQTEDEGELFDPCRIMEM